MLRHIQSQFNRCLVTLSCALAIFAGATLTLLPDTSLAHAAQSAQATASGACLQPPAHRDLTMLSNAQLLRYGLPQRPLSSSDLKQWIYVIRHAKHRTCAIRPAMPAQQFALDTPGRPYGEVDTSTIWAGIVAYNSGYQLATANWTEPDVSSTSQARSGTLGFWVGLGGDPQHGGGYLVQAGTEVEYAGGKQTYSAAWIEDYPYNDAQALDKWQPASGDHIYAQVGNYYQVGRPIQVQYLLEDSSQNLYFSEVFAWPPSNGSTADWSTEGRAPLLQFHSANPNCPANTNCVSFYNDTATRNGTQENIGSLTTAAIFLKNPKTGDTLANPGGIHNNTFFNDYWQASS